MLPCAEQNNMHRFMNVADALLICQFAPGQRRLRVSYFPEASMGLTALVSCGVASFFLLYFGILLLFFTVSCRSAAPKYTIKGDEMLLDAKPGFCRYGCII